MSRVVIQNFPIGISVNNTLRTSPYHRGLAPTKEKEEFDKRCKYWALVNQQFVAQAAIEVNRWADQGHVLQVTLFHIFQKQRVITKSKPVRPQNMDGHNRSKALIDALCKMLKIDDRYIFTLTEHKVFTDDEKDKECTTIIMEPTALKTRCEIQSMLATHHNQIQTTPNSSLVPTLDKR